MKIQKVIIENVKNFKNRSDRCINCANVNLSFSSQTGDYRSFVL